MTDKKKQSDCSIKYLTTVDSTNLYAKRNYESLQNKTLIVAEQQTAGKGRLDRTWLSPVNENIYASFVVKRPNFPIYMATWICGLATLQTLREFTEDTSLPLWLKWPNDVYCSYKKISGILCEGVLDNKNQIDGIIIGVGININSSSEFLSQLDQAATSLKIETAHDEAYDLKIIAEKLAVNFEKYFNVAESSTELLYQLWRNENKLINQRISIISPNNECLEGIVKDINENGEIVFEIDDKEQIILCGDIKIQKETIKNLQFS